MKVTAIKCPNCNDVIYSRTRHDMRWCSCGKVAIDGGREYTKLLYPPEYNDLETITIEVDATNDQLYNDWNNETDNYGIIMDDDSKSSELKPDGLSEHLDALLDAASDSIKSAKETVKRNIMNEYEYKYKKELWKTYGRNMEREKVIELIDEKLKDLNGFAEDDCNKLIVENMGDVLKNLKQQIEERAEC